MRKQEIERTSGVEERKKQGEKGKSKGVKARGLADNQGQEAHGGISCCKKKLKEERDREMGYRL